MHARVPPFPTPPLPTHPTLPTPHLPNPPHPPTHPVSLCSRQRAWRSWRKEGCVCPYASHLQYTEQMVPRAHLPTDTHRRHTQTHHFTSLRTHTHMCTGIHTQTERDRHTHTQTHKHTHTHTQTHTHTLFLSSRTFLTAYSRLAACGVRACLKDVEEEVSDIKVSTDTFATSTIYTHMLRLYMCCGPFALAVALTLTLILSLSMPSLNTVTRSYYVPQN